MSQNPIRFTVLGPVRAFSGDRRYSVFLSIDAEYATVARDAARAAVAFDRVGQILPAVRRAAERNPLDESLQARLMLMLAADGRQADAFALFQWVRDTLARELGVDPGAELRAAYDEVLQPRPRAAERAALDAIVEACGRLPAALTAVATETCRRLDGLAARLRRDSLDALGGLRTAFAGSYEALPEPAARLFRLLSLHPGRDLTPAAVASLAGRPERETVPVLARLTGENLLLTTPSQRLASHALLTAYAKELSPKRDQPAELDAAETRLFAHYRHTAYEANRLLCPLLEPPDPGVRPEGVTVEEFGDHRGAFRWFRTGHRVLRALIERRDGPGVWQFATTMVPFYQGSGLRHEWLAPARAALVSAERTGDRLGEAHMQRCLAGCLRLGDRRGVAGCLLGLGQLRQRPVSPRSRPARCAARSSCTAKPATGPGRPKP
ncbi:BTAD domain-containing putative transcriptional regulator [Actinoplanes sp. NPDC048988]|uniref:AfsR/SARP family transcriptional regulator n=1 Tax=Actinoplanes sp. NPDC048988 TaxID=3363901 RepID=UPI003721B46D